MARLYTLDLVLRSDPLRAWSIVAATDRIDADSGLSALLYRDEPQPDGTSRRFFTQRVKGLKVEGEEYPFTWEYPRRFEVHRRYDRGPFRSSIHRCSVEPVDPARPSAGSRVIQQFELEGRGILGAIFVHGFGREVLPAMEKAIRAWDLREQPPTVGGTPVLAVEALEKPSIGESRFSAVLGALRADAPGPVWDNLERLVRVGDDYDVHRIRPLACARAWALPVDVVIDAFLLATRHGLLVLRWDVICPHCRGDKENLTSLQDVRPAATCPACNLRFDIDLDRSLEAVFTPHRDIREVEVARYCLGGPGTTPHIRYQRRLEPGESWSPSLQLPPGRYRLRATGIERFRWIHVGLDDGEAPEGTIELDEKGLTGPDLRVPALSPSPLELRAPADQARLVIVEDTAWTQDALPAGELIADQRFRDLFAREMLAPGVSLAVERITIVFTDLVGSTRMYGQIGDARAFSLVWSHFELLRELVDGRRGATVKTIGDAIMASFPRVEDALAVAAELHTRIEPYLQEHGHQYPVHMKVGVHAGPAIVVTLNERLDYFGTTVNLAARTEAQSKGQDIVVSASTVENGEDASLRGAGWIPEPFEAHPKGFDRPIPMLRYRRA